MERIPIPGIEVTIGGGKEGVITFGFDNIEKLSCKPPTPVSIYIAGDFKSSWPGHPCDERASQSNEIRRVS
jgi:hypothetical protein